MRKDRPSDKRFFHKAAPGFEPLQPVDRAKNNQRRRDELRQGRNRDRADRRAAIEKARLEELEDET